MSLIDPSQELVVTGVSFAEGSLEFTYLEKREQGDAVGMMRTIFIDSQRCKLSRQHEELVEACVDMIEAGLLALRNPEPQLDPRKRFRTPRPPADIAESDEADL